MGTSVRARHTAVPHVQRIDLRHIEPLLVPTFARRWCRETLSGWGDPVALLVDSILIALSELATNSVTHAGDVEEAVLILADGEVLVAVADAVPMMAVPSQSCVSEDDETGRGLYLVGAISKEWGVKRVPARKYVWATFELAKEE